MIILYTSPAIARNRCMAPTSALTSSGTFCVFAKVFTGGKIFLFCIETMQHISILTFLLLHFSLLTSFFSCLLWSSTPLLSISSTRVARIFTTVSLLSSFYNICLYFLESICTAWTMSHTVLLKRTVVSSLSLIGANILARPTPSLSLFDSLITPGRWSPERGTPPLLTSSFAFRRVGLLTYSWKRTVRITIRPS